MTRDGVIGKRVEQRLLPARCVLKGAHTQVAARNARQHSTGQHGLAHDGFARCNHSQTARGRDPQRMHRFADDVLTQHRPHGGTPIAAARVGRLPRAFEGDVHTLAGWCEVFAQQQGSSITKHREVAKLMARIRLRDGLGALGQHLTRPDARSLQRILRDIVQAQLARQSVVPHHHLRCTHTRGCRSFVEGGR